MKKIIALFITAALSLSITAGCSSGNNSKTSESSESSESSFVIATPDSVIDKDTEIEVFTIKTDYAELRYPKYWEGKVSVKAEKQTVSFTAENEKVKLFDLLFDSEQGYRLGSFTSDGKNHTLNIVEGEIDKKSENINTYMQMQDDVNVLVSFLKKDYGFESASETTTEGSAVDEEKEKEKNVFEIKTGVVSLYYPSKWQSKVKTEVKSDRVLFSCGDEKLFDIVFGGKDGDLLGKYKDTEVRIVPYELKNSTDELIEMQEDVNVLLHKLMEDKAFSAAAN